MITAFPYGAGQTQSQMRSITLRFLFASMFLASCGAFGQQVSLRSPSGEVAEYEIVTLLPKDAIPSIDNPQFQSASEADQEYDPNEQVLGVEIDGDSRAYPTGLLSSHEIVNDVVGGHPIAVTW